MVLINVPVFFSADPLRVVEYNAVRAGWIPLDPLTRSKFTEIDHFVEQAMECPQYKPICHGDNILVNFSKWCKYYKILPDGSRQPMSPDTFLGKGMYTIVLQASHVYVGPHKSGATHSVSLHIRELFYEPEQNLNDWFDVITGVSSSDNSNDIPKPKASKRRAPKKKRGKDEVDAMPSA